MVADDVAVLRLRTNTILFGVRNKKAFVLVVRLPVPRIRVPPRPDPRANWNIQTCFFTQLPPRRLLKALIPFQAAARRYPESVTVRGVLRIQQQQSMPCVEEKNAGNRSGSVH